MAGSSRVTRAGAGWGCGVGTAKDIWDDYCGASEAGKAAVNLPEPPLTGWAERFSWAEPLLGRYADYVDKVASTPFAERPQFSWVQPANLWQSRNDRIARYMDYPIDEERRRWVAALKKKRPGEEDFVVDRSDLGAVKFLVFGDPGEGDLSQFALVPPLLARGQDTDFAFVCSDVIYPAGSINQYADKFYCPYKGYPNRIYAVPGNHDWYDGLVGFMHHFCGVEAWERPAANGSAHPVKERIREKLWRKADRKDDEEIARGKGLRPTPTQRPDQPGPYFVIDTKPLRIVGIDTGIVGKLDHDQGEWLRRVSSETPKPKVLITGKPIYVDGKHKPGEIEGGGTIDEIVRSPKHNYVAVIGGDTHNYQRYPVTLDGRTINYIVSGGGGAYLSATHKISKVRLPGVDEDRFRCYPLRGDSLSYYSNLYERAAARWREYLRHNRVVSWLRLPVPERAPRFTIPPGEASALMGEHLGIPPTREVDRGLPVSDDALRAARRLLRRPGRPRPYLHSWYYAYLPWTHPPFFNSFLRVEATMRELTITCYGVTGCGEHETDPPEEDKVVVPLEG